MSSLVAPLILALVLGAIFFRQRIGNLAPWKAMLAGAIVVLLVGTISPSDAFRSIDWGVMLFLYGMMLLGNGMEESGYLQHIGYRIMRTVGSPFGLLASVVFAVGIGSALLLNDTLAIVGTPLCILLAHKSGILARPLLIALALAVTVGSVMSPIGNPQNYLIASKLADPFGAFFVYLAVPTMLSLLALTSLLWWRFPDLRRLRALGEKEGKRDHQYFAARLALQVVVALSLVRLASLFFSFIPQFELYWIALVGAAVYAVGSKRIENALRTDWETLAFFAGMFILTEAVWMSGAFQSFMPQAQQLGETFVIIPASLLLSQVLSNVPFVIFYLKALEAAGPIATTTLVLLAMASTLAGALTIIGAASNIIIIQSASKHCEDLPAKEFMLIGAAITITQVGLTLGWMGVLKIAGIN